MQAPRSCERYLTLDGLRGMAVMGILLINITAFGLPDAAYFSPTAYGAGRTVDVITWAFNLVLVDGKMRNLFSLLFGASMLLVIERAEAAGLGGARIHFARMGWLLVFGLFHFYFIWTGDILSQYAVLGMLAYGLRSLRARTLFLLGASFLVGQFIVTSGFAIWLFTLREAAQADGAAADAVRAWYRYGAALGQLNPDAMANEVARYRQDYGDILAYRFRALWLGPVTILAIGGAETLGMILLGMAGLKSGFLTGAWDRVSYHRVAARGYMIGLPVMLVLLAWCIASGFEPLVGFAVVTGFSGLARPFIMAGHAALLILWFTGGESPVRRRIAAVGRAAFTNYIATSLVMTSVFYGYGLGLFGAVGRAELILFVLAAWAVMLAWSKPWLDRFAYGPLEWLWRSLARGRAQPLRKNISAPA